MEIKTDVQAGRSLRLPRKGKRGNYAIFSPDVRLSQTRFFLEGYFFLRVVALPLVRVLAEASAISACAAP